MNGEVKRSYTQSSQPQYPWKRFTYLWSAVAFGICVEQRALGQNIFTVYGCHPRVLEDVGQRRKERMECVPGYVFELRPP